MRQDHHDDFDELLRSTRRRSRARHRERVLRSWGVALLAPLVTVLGVLLIYSYGEWSTPYDRRESPAAVTDFRVSPLPSRPDSLPELVQRDIDLLVEVDAVATPPRDSRDLAALRTERRVTLLRAYAVLRYDEAGPLLEDVVDTAMNERVRREAVMMLGYVGNPSWRLLDELVDARDAGRDLMPYLRALRYFFSATTDPPPWIRNAVRELVSIAEECPRLECRRAAASAFARAARADLGSDWIEEVERLARNPDHECRTRALCPVRGATAALHPERCSAIIAQSLESRHESEVIAAASRAAGLPHTAITARSREALGAVASDAKRSLALRTAASRALRGIEGPRSEVSPPRAQTKSSPDSGALRARLREIIKDRSNTSKSGRDVVQEGRHAYAADPLRRIAREIRREVLK